VKGSHLDYRKREANMIAMSSTRKTFNKKM